MGPARGLDEYFAHPTARVAIVSTTALDASWLRSDLESTGFNEKDVIAFDGRTDLVQSLTLLGESIEALALIEVAIGAEGATERAGHQRARAEL